MSQLQEGDWVCAACQHMNFKRREACQRCSCPKFASEADIELHVRNRSSEVLLRPGDWYCSSCCAHNFASRTNCYKCGMFVLAQGSFGYDASALPGYKTGDWICNRYGCGWHNYASRTECHKCRTPRDFGDDP